MRKASGTNLNTLCDLIPDKSPHGDVPSTRQQIAEHLLCGPFTAAALADVLRLSVPAVRRHLDIMVVEGLAVTANPSPYQHRGRGRPAKLFHLTTTGRDMFGHTYDDLAVDALHFLRKACGERAIIDFSKDYMERITADVTPVGEAPTREEVEACAAAIVSAFNKHGFTSTVDTALGGVQICHHHCPVAEVAHVFPAMCAAEHHVLSELLGLPLQRLSSLAHGAHTCTTNIGLTTSVNLPTTFESKRK